MCWALNISVWLVLQVSKGSGEGRHVTAGQALEKGGWGHGPCNSRASTGEGGMGTWPPFSEISPSNEILTIHVECTKHCYTHKGFSEFRGLPPIFFYKLLLALNIPI